ncbi:hypothetical protein [Acetobacter sp.]|uniref:hypothetical protein n=1 Tax=Acetobacter sp. TaxID=440 RepID=UPI0039E9ADED
MKSQPIKRHQCAPELAGIMFNEIEKYRAARELPLQEACQELHISTGQYNYLRTGGFLTGTTFLSLCYLLDLDMATIGKMIDIAGQDAEEQRAASVRLVQACATPKTAKAGSVGTTRPAL